MAATFIPKNEKKHNPESKSEKLTQTASNDTRKSPNICHFATNLAVPNKSSLIETAKAVATGSAFYV
ncbi:hypothetical protein THIOM_000272 [Candidatus Thiomargarita nelsonii]|uniref:Uncharacterized protein n=1 Tax=Candidatus Thiomargarita nelsonii TaxID=1003181 RepID=A0A176S734_9GAMM|nr:hypothetical protein THIOM_000272 [Candidatus Thiomargarita nelsonii]